MKIKGMDKFREKLPSFSGKRIVILPIYAVMLLTILVLVIHYLNSISIIKPSTFSGVTPLIGVIVIEVVAFISVFIIFNWRDTIKARFPKTCYQRILFVGFIGIESLIFLSFNSFFPPSIFHPEVWLNMPYSIWMEPVTSLIGENWIILDIIRKIMGILCLIIGLGTILRSLFTFGFDYMAVVYLYFPEESEVQNHKIYSILRHPTYAGLIYICLGAFIFYFSIYNLIYFLMYFIGFFIHIHFVEEKELISRFGDSYLEYRKKVPAFFVHPKKWIKFLGFLVGSRD